MSHTFCCRFFTSLHFYSNFMHTYYKLSVQIVALWHRKSVARTKRRFLHFFQPWIAVRFPVGKLLSRKDLNASPAGIVRREKGLSASYYRKTRTQQLHIKSPILNILVSKYMFIQIQCFQYKEYFSKNSIWYVNIGKRRDHHAQKISVKSTLF